MHANEKLINDFYRAFQKRDWQGMRQCYSAGIHFSDPVFNDLHGDDVSAMWHMLCDNANDFELKFNGVQADDSSGSACWQATYTFLQTGRRVHNVIFSEFQFVDGLISRHSDHFSLWRWSRMAFGPVGVIFGWSGYFKRKVQQKGLSGLNRFIRRYHLKKDA